MKKTLLLTLALGLSAVTLMAGTVQVYVTGATAFRKNVYAACQALYSSPPTIYYADLTHGGDGNNNNGTASWVMTGSPVSTLTNLQGNTLIVHGNFTGSVQGIKTVEQATLLQFASPAGVSGGFASAYETNVPTIGFSDASGASTPYPASGNYVEENVCIQPFVMLKSVASGGVTNINNVSWEQYRYGIIHGRVPLASWTGKITDTNTFVYLYERTDDSGTRRNETSQMGYEYADPVGVYIYDLTNHLWYTPTVLSNSFTGFAPYGVIGTEGPGDQNVNISSEFWFGYIGGGDIKTHLKDNNIANQGISYLSIADAQGVGASNWATVVSFNGFWPTAAGVGIHGNTVANDYSPITLGYYACWGLEVLVHPTDPSLVNYHGIGSQTISQTQLGDQFTPGTFMGVFNAQTVINGGSPIVGSIEKTIVDSKTGGSLFPATAIPLADMVNTRDSVGGIIEPIGK